MKGAYIFIEMSKNFKDIFQIIINDPILSKNREAENRYGITDMTLRVAVEANILSEEKNRASDLDNNECISIYEELYWRNSGCEEMLYPLNLIHFDNVLDSGISNANKGLQITINEIMGYGVIPVNGFIDQNTKRYLIRLANTNEDVIQFCFDYLNIREDYYRNFAKKRIRNRLLLPDKLNRLKTLYNILVEVDTKLDKDKDEVIS